MSGGGVSSIGGFLGEGIPGSTVPVAQIAIEARFTVFASLEPDADNDGYGDETQDKCRRARRPRPPCPVLPLSTSPCARKGLVKVLDHGQLPGVGDRRGLGQLGKGKTAP